MSKLTVTIPDDLHQKIREELERQGITTSQFIEQAVTTFFEKPKGVSNMATRTLAFQVSEELLQRIKTFLARYEQIYHRKLSQKEFLAHLIERELDEAEKDYERITTEQAAEENADVDSGEPDGTEMEVDPLHRLRCRRSAHILRSQQPRTAAASQRPVERARTSNSDFRHAGSSRGFQPHGTAFGADNLSPLASFPCRFSV